MDADLGRAWSAADEAAAPGWRLVALVHGDLARMAIGLHPALEEDLRTIDSDPTAGDWVALAAGAGSEWILGTGDRPSDALRALAARLRARAGA